MAAGRKSFVIGLLLCALLGFGIQSFAAVSVAEFVGSDFVPDEILNFKASEWDARGEHAYWADDAAGNRYLFAVHQELSNVKTPRWLLALTLFGKEKPELFIWIDNRFEYDMRKGVLLENGAIVHGAEMKFEAIPGDAASAPYGTIRVFVFDDKDRAVAQRDFRALLVPVPSRNCSLSRNLPWRVMNNMLGEISYWECPGKDGSKFQIMGIEAEGEAVFQTWAVGEKKFVALTLANRHRIVTEVSDNISSWYFDIYKNPFAVTIELYVGGIDGTRFQRVIKFPAQ